LKTKCRVWVEWGIEEAHSGGWLSRFDDEVTPERLTIHTTSVTEAGTNVTTSTSGKWLARWDIIPQTRIPV